MLNQAAIYYIADSKHCRWNRFNFKATYEITSNIKELMITILCHHPKGSLLLQAKMVKLGAEFRSQINRIRENGFDMNKYPYHLLNLLSTQLFAFKCYETMMDLHRFPYNVLGPLKNISRIWAADFDLSTPNLDEHFEFFKYIASCSSEMQLHIETLIVELKLNEKKSAMATMADLTTFKLPERLASMTFRRFRHYFAVNQFMTKITQEKYQKVIIYLAEAFSDVIGTTPSTVSNPAAFHLIVLIFVLIGSNQMSYTSSDIV